MKILTAPQIREADRYTIEHEPVSSLDLMERAAFQCFKWIQLNVGKQHIIHVVCGQGNNGGDGLCISRMLMHDGYRVLVYIIGLPGAGSPDFNVNRERLQSINSQSIRYISTAAEFPETESGDVVIDAIFGTGLKRNVSDQEAEIIRKINLSGCQIISIDMPSGIYSDKTSLSTGNEIIKSSKTLTFQYPKRGLLIPENSSFSAEMVILDIGLSGEYDRAVSTPYFFIDPDMAKQIVLPRSEFSHKGNYGHSLLITSGLGKTGAGILAASALLRSGGGLLTCCVPGGSLVAMNVACPEAMTISDPDKEMITTVPDLKAYTVIGVGPGLGMNPLTVAMIDRLLEVWSGKLVLDADALNILSANPDWWSRLPENALLTPHPGEFKRMVGNWKDDFEKLDKQLQFASKYKVIVVLKGKYTTIALPDGNLYFNSTGNAGMAKGGSGDVLTGFLTGLLASGYSPASTAQLGVFLHGFAGDLAAKKSSQQGMTAMDIVKELGTSWKSVL